MEKEDLEELNKKQEMYRHSMSHILAKAIKELYPNVATKHKTTVAKVERSIRHAIEVCWLKGRIDVLEDTFGYTISPERGKPTNSEFIAMVADKMRMKMRLLNK